MCLFRYCDFVQRFCRALQPLLVSCLGGCAAADNNSGALEDNVNYKNVDKADIKDAADDTDNENDNFKCAHLFDTDEYDKPWDDDLPRFTHWMMVVQQHQQKLKTRRPPPPPPGKPPR